MVYIVSSGGRAISTPDFGAKDLSTRSVSFPIVGSPRRWSVSNDQVTQKVHPLSVHWRALSKFLKGDTDRSRRPAQSEPREPTSEHFDGFEV